MKRAVLIPAIIEATLLLLVSIEFAVAAGIDDEPDLVITPNTIRIQPLNDPTKGQWIVMPGFSELGSPTFSKDGQWIAFDAYKQGFNNSSAECWIARRDGSDLKRLVFGATPRFSPDGKRLLFMRQPVNDASREEGVYVINRDGSGEERIGPGRWPDWSPDGAEIVFSMGGQAIGGARIGATLWISKADGSDRRELVDGDCPSWSPDGRKIAYCYREQGRPPMIRVFDLRENAEATLGIGWFRANWMPDSKTVVANGMNGRDQVMVRLSLTIPRKVVEQSTEYEDPFSPTISADGQEILFIARRPRTAPR
jgi:dipeptidyl aminopeptidase/acylaminoacyl peptidase